MRAWEIFCAAFTGHAIYLFDELTEPRWNGFVLWPIVCGAACFALEARRPWRDQPAYQRQDFGLDAFYLVFNLMLFPLFGFQAACAVVAHGGQLVGEFVGVDFTQGYVPMSWSLGAKVFVLFVVRDFVQWNIHRLLHRVPFLWRFHAVHHSARELGFATHFRFHPMESVVYRTLEYIPLALLGLGVTDMTVIYMFAVLVGHLNHTNVRLPLGWFKFVLNNPQMHRWHHVIDLPRRGGVNFGITLSVWDYLFRTAYLPHDAAGEELGMRELQMPAGFWAQTLFPFR